MRDVFPRGKRAALVRRYPAVASFSLCAVFSCFHNPPNSDIDYRVFNVRTPTSEHILLTRKNSHNCFLVLWTGFEPLVFGSRVDALPTEPPRHPLSGNMLRAILGCFPLRLLAQEGSTVLGSLSWPTLSFRANKDTRVSFTRQFSSGNY